MFCFTKFPSFRANLTKWIIEPLNNEIVCVNVINYANLTFSLDVMSTIESKQKSYGKLSHRTSHIAHCGREKHTNSQIHKRTHSASILLCVRSRYKEWWFGNFVKCEMRQLHTFDILCEVELIVAWLVLIMIFVSAGWISSVCIYFVIPETGLKTSIQVKTTTVTVLRAFVWCYFGV